MENILEVYSGQGFQKFSFKIAVSLDRKRFGRFIPPSGTSANYDAIALYCRNHRQSNPKVS